MMSKRVTQAALKLLLLLEEYSRDELSQAITIISRKDYPAAPLQIETDKGKTVSSKKQPQMSLALFSLRETDKQKYALLADIDMQLRNGTLLPGLSNLRKFAETIDKKLASVKNRTSIISKLMTILVKEDLNVLTAISQKIGSTQLQGSSNVGYKELAHFIISGHSKEPSEP